MYDTNKRIIKEIALEDIKLKIQASFFMLLSNTKMLKDKGCWNIPYEKNNDIIVIEDKIFNCVSRLDSFLQNNSKERDKQITEFIKLKNDFIVISESIYAYFYYNDHLIKIVNNQLKLLLSKDNNDKSLSKDYIYNTCLSIIESSENKEEKISYIMSILPIKMTREKYYDYTTDSINIMLKNGNKNYINNVIKNLKLKFLPNQIPNYGLYYTQIKDKLSTIDRIDIEGLDYDQLFEIYESLTDNLEIFSEIEDYLSSIYESLNYIIYILTFAQDMDYILEDNLIYKDIFFSCKNMLNDELDNEFKGKLDDLISDTCERLVDLIIDIEKGKSQMFENIKTKNIPKDILDILRINQIITDAYYETLSDTVYLVNLPVDSTENLDLIYLENKIKDFIEFINTSLDRLTPNKKRLTKQFFLENLPTPFDLQDFTNYLNYILNNTNNNEKQLIIEGIESLYNSNINNKKNCHCGCHTNQ